MLLFEGGDELNRSNNFRLDYPIYGGSFKPDLLIEGAAQPGPGDTTSQLFAYIRYEDEGDTIEESVTLRYIGIFEGKGEWAAQRSIQIGRIGSPMDNFRLHKIKNANLEDIWPI